MGEFEKNHWSSIYWGYNFKKDELEKVFNRPYPVAVCGDIKEIKTDSKNRKFSLIWTCERDFPDNMKTEIYVPYKGFVEYENKNTVLQITLYQGMNRQIRKMLDHLGHPVISLKRVSHGTINIQGLKKGQFKYIKPKEINDLIKHINKLEKQAKK